MTRPVAYLLSLLFLGGFLWLDFRTELYDTAIPYFGAVLFLLWSPKRVDVLITSMVCLAATFAGGFFSIGEDKTLADGMGAVVVERSLSLFALVCVSCVGWQRRGISLSLQEMNRMLEERVVVSEKEANEIQQQLSEIANELDQYTVERRQKEREFRETIASYQTLLESLPINVFQKDRKARLTFGNERFFKTLGKTRDACIGKTDFELFPESLAKKYHADDQQVIATGQPVELVEEHVRADGTTIYVQVFKAPIRNSWKKIIGLQGMFWDVTDRVEAEKSQQESDARFRRLVNSNIIGIFTGSMDGRILDANDEFLNLIGENRQALDAGDIDWNRLTPDEFSEIDRTMQRELVEKGFCRPLEKEYLHENGRRIPVLVGAVQSNPEEKEVIFSVVDITSQKDAERALQMAKDAADEANRSKTLFLANMSHEIRTPLNAIIGMTDLVLQSRVSREQAEYLRMANDSGEALLEIISDILDFSKLQAGKMKLKPDSFSLRSKIGEILRPLSIRAHEKGLKTVCDIAGDAPDSLRGDPVCLRQVLTNLVSNAIKFTQEGEIIVSVTSEEVSDGEARVHFAVTDTGPGIAADIQKKIFKEFEQADNTSSRLYGGTGLGLAICSNLVNLLGGEIWVESEPGQGSTFHFTAMLEVEPDGVIQSAPVPADFDPGHILLIDEHARSLDVMQGILERWDLTVKPCADVNEGMRELRRPEAGYRILVLDEMSIGESDRAEWAEIRKANPELNTILLKSTLTGEQSASRIPPGLAVEFSLLKPVQESELFDAISQALSNRPSVSIPVTEAEPQLPPLRVLLAEDNLVNQRLAVAILSQRNHDVQIASDGEEAISLATSRDFDLILMDIQMPKMDGVEATRVIRAGEKDSPHRATIIALTAHAAESDRARCLEAGMDGYVTKPLRPLLLMSEISKRISRSSETDRALERSVQVDSEKANATDDGLRESESRQAGRVNWDEALIQTANDHELLRELIQIFERESPIVLNEIEEAVRQGDRKRMSLKAHHLKGSFRVFACRDGLEVAQRLEDLGEKEPAEPVLEKLKHEYEAVFKELTAYLVQDG
ncbi:MAG: ATP-binding protein [Planctomycetota bacterium]|nr:ATP-binding protein [Planctomycetota bacterium]